MVCDGGCASVEGSVGAPLVVLVDEGVELCLEFGDCGGAGLSGEPFFECLVEAFDFAAGRGVVRAGVLLGDPEVRECGFEVVAAAAESGETDGVDKSVVGED